MVNAKVSPAFHIAITNDTLRELVIVSSVCVCPIGHAIHASFTPERALPIKLSSTRRLTCRRTSLRISSCKRAVIVNYSPVPRKASVQARPRAALSVAAGNVIAGVLPQDE